VIAALWTHNNSNWPTSSGTYSSTYSTPYALTVNSTGTNGTVSVIDMMGNVSSVSYTNGVANLTLTESPIYVVLANANAIQGKYTAPVGYTGQ